jgi:hypothetical protein
LIGWYGAVLLATQLISTRQQCANFMHFEVRAGNFKMRILIVPFMYLPDGGPAAPLYTMLSEALDQSGHEVTAIAAVPYYPKVPGAKRARARGDGVHPERGVNVMEVPAVANTSFNENASWFGPCRNRWGGGRLQTIPEY